MGEARAAELLRAAHHIRGRAAGRALLIRQGAIRVLTRRPRAAGQLWGAGGGRHAERLPLRGGRGGARRGRDRRAREERVPGEHEPRDSHADERRHRHDRAAARHAADARAARYRGHDPPSRRGPARRSSTTSWTSPRSRPASSISKSPTSTCARPSRASSELLAETAHAKGLELPVWCTTTCQPPCAAMPRASVRSFQPRRQCGEVHRAGRSRRTRPDRRRQPAARRRERGNRRRRRGARLVGGGQLDGRRRRGCLGTLRLARPDRPGLVGARPLRGHGYRHRHRSGGSRTAIRVVRAGGHVYHAPLWRHGPRVWRSPSSWRS